MLTPEQIKEMRERHEAPILCKCGDWWPCDALLALDEVKRLRRVVRNISPYVADLMEATDADAR